MHVESGHIRFRVPSKDNRTALEKVSVTSKGLKVPRNWPRTKLGRGCFDSDNSNSRENSVFLDKSNPSLY